MGENISIDECMHQNDLFTFVSNKDGHGKKGTLIAAVRGTKASEVIRILMQIPEDKRLAVKEVTMDYSDSMHAIVEAAFPQSDITIDVFHVIKNQCDALDEMRMRFKRKAISEQAKDKREFNKARKRRKGQTTARIIRRSVAKSVAGQESVPTNSSSQRNCPQATPRWSCSPMPDTFFPRVERNGVKSRRQKQTCCLNWLRNSRRLILWCAN